MEEVSDKLYHKSSCSEFQDCSGQDCTASQRHHFGSGEHSNLLKKWISRAKQDTEKERGLALEEQDGHRQQEKAKKEDYFSVFNTELTTHPSPFTGQWKQHKHYTFFI